ncbi:MAG: hypothetical protein AAGI01_00735 [Myxococcota bacterium]
MTVPSLELAAERTTKARARCVVRVTWTAATPRTRVRTFEGVDLAPGEDIRLSDDTTWSSTSRGPERIAWILLAATSPIAAFGAWVGAPSSASSTVVLQGDDFVFQYGVSPRILVRRDLRMIAGMETGPWRVATSGQLDGVALPERVRIERDGALSASARLELVAVKTDRKKKR